ncbi:MAG: AAA family ATPase [Colwellia sp.]|nr:AAA family ATPase [Colwellia sp.]
MKDKIAAKPFIRSLNKPTVIAISGASGCGKTTLVKQLAKRFECPYLLFDDYIDKESYPINMEAWYHQGANVSLIKTTRFIDAITAALNFFHDDKYLFIEEPFGRQRDSLALLIDTVVLLDMPQELCLERVIQRNKLNGGDNFNLASYLKKYNDYFKDIYVNAVTQVRNNCDLVLDEELAPLELTEKTSQWLQRHETF